MPYTPGHATRSRTFTYDQLNRITGALTTSTYATSPTHCWGETYSLDAGGPQEANLGGGPFDLEGSGFRASVKHKRHERAPRPTRVA
jgi:hypothetical protein